MFLSCRLCFQKQEPNRWLFGSLWRTVWSEEGTTHKFPDLVVYSIHWIRQCHRFYWCGLFGFQVGLTGHIFSGSSIRNILVREAKNHAAIALVVGYVEHAFHNFCFGFSLSDVSILLIFPSLICLKDYLHISIAGVELPQLNIMPNSFHSPPMF